MFIKNFISPIPQNFDLLDGNDVVLGVPGKGFYQIEVTLDKQNELTDSAVKLLRESLSTKLNVHPSSNDGDVKITLSIADAPEAVANHEQAYSIVVENNSVSVTGYGASGLYYGVLTLTQCLKLEDNILKLPSMKIVDWPDLKTRGHFMESRYGSNLMTLDDWKHVVDHMAGMKMNQLVVSVYGCWCVQYDGRVSEYLYVPIKKYPKLETPVVTRYYSPKRDMG